MASFPFCPSSAAAATAAITGGTRGRAACPAGPAGSANCAAAMAVASGLRRRLLLREVAAAVAPTAAAHCFCSAPASLGTATARKSPSPTLAPAVPRRVSGFPAAAAAGGAAAEAAAGKPAKALLSLGQRLRPPPSSMHWRENRMQRGKRRWRGTRISCHGSGSNSSSGNASSSGGSSSSSRRTTCSAANGSIGGTSGGATTPAAAAAAAATAAASPTAAATASLTPLSEAASDGDNALHQTTIARAVDVSGIGLHSGLRTQVTLRPAAAGQGRYFLLPSPTAAAVVVSAAGTGTESEASDEACGGDNDVNNTWVRVDANIANAVESRLCTVLRSVLQTEGQVLREGVGSMVRSGVAAEGDGPAGGAADGKRAMVRAVEVRTVEHLLSALEGVGVDNVAIVVQPLENDDGHALELPLLDGSSQPWVSLLLDEAGLAAAAAEPEAAAAAASAAPMASIGQSQTQQGSSALQQPSVQKRMVFVGQPALDHHAEQQGSAAALQQTSFRPKALVEGQELELVRRGDWHGVAELAPLVVRGEADGSDSFVAAFPHPWPMLTCAIDFSQLPAVGKQWVSWSPVPCPADELSSHVLTLRCGTTGYSSDVAPARTFAILEQVEQLQKAGLIKGGSLDNALVCSMKTGWVNPPLRFADEPCRHKLLDLIGDLSLLADKGEPALPCAHIVAYKASHALHLRFAVKLREWLKAQPA